MDLNQNKLTKNEWNNTEISVDNEEEKILKLICKGYHDVNLIYNDNLSVLGFAKLEASQEMHEYLYRLYFEKDIDKLVKNNELDFSVSLSKKKKVKIR